MIIIHKLTKYFKENPVTRQQAWELYCSLCNQVWIHKDYDKEVYQKLSELRWVNLVSDKKDFKVKNREFNDKFPYRLDMSWRAAGGLINDVCESNEEGYMSFYCCRREGGISEGEVTNFAEKTWNNLGLKLFKDFYKEA